MPTVVRPLTIRVTRLLTVTMGFAGAVTVTRFVETLVDTTVAVAVTSPLNKVDVSVKVVESVPEENTCVRVVVPITSWEK